MDLAIYMWLIMMLAFGVFWLIFGVFKDSSKRKNKFRGRSFRACDNFFEDSGCGDSGCGDSGCGDSGCGGGGCGGGGCGGGGCGGGGD